MSFGSEINEIYKSIQNDLIEQANKASINAVNRFLKEKAMPTIQGLFGDAIDAFYSDYSPIYYERNLSLYDILDMEIKNGDELASLEYGFNPDAVTALRNGGSGEGGLYNQVFREGWHGGAVGKKADSRGVIPSSPTWRYPYELYRWWGHEAARASISPLEDVDQRIAEYWNGSAEGELKEYWDAAFDELK